MIYFKYNPLIKEYKSVLGAVEEGNTFSLSVDVATQLDVKLTLLLKSDDGEFVRYAMQPTTTEGGFTRHTADVCLTKGLYWYCFEVSRSDCVTYIGWSEYGANMFVFLPSLFQLLCFKAEYAVPQWLSDGVTYHIFVDRFCNGDGTVRLRKGQVARNWGETPNRANAQGEVWCNDFFGGDIQGIISKLDYIQSLGVTCIYLSPVFTAFSNHKYDTYDYEQIDSAFGSNDDFASLCRNCEQRGIRIILDGVFNHSGVNGRYFNEAKEYGNLPARDPLSPYHDWFMFDASGNYQCWWTIKTLPRHNADSASLAEYLTGEQGIVAKWLRLGASGWRLDVVDEINDNMLDKIVRCAKKEKADAAVIGEVWEDATTKISYGVRRKYFQGGQLDSVMNYPLKEAILDFVRNGNAVRLNNVMNSLVSNYPSYALANLMSLLTTHDTPRALTALGDAPDIHPGDTKAVHVLSGGEYFAARELLMKAALLQYTLIGFPSLFYGDEAGLSGYSDPYCRRCYPWGNEDNYLIDYYRALGRLRKEYKDAFVGQYQQCAFAQGYFAFKRIGVEHTLLVVVSSSRVKLPLDGEYVDFFSGVRYCDTFNCDTANTVLIKQ